MGEMLSYMLHVAGLMLDGLKYTVGVFFITLVLSVPLGLLLTFLRVSKIWPLRAFTSFYVWLMRGTPLLLQLFFFYYGLTFIPVVKDFLTMDRFTASRVAFTLNYAAYFCEIFRGGLLAIDRGQYEASKVLGLAGWQTFYKVVLPQMLRVTLPSVSNECITLVKDTALVTVIGVTEILYFAKATVNRDVNAQAYIVAAVFYLILNYGVSRFFTSLEKKYSF